VTDPRTVDAAAAVDAGAAVDALRDAVDGERRRPVAIVVVPGVGLGLAYGDRSWRVATGDPASLVTRLDDAIGPRWVWWNTATARALVGSDARVQSCWDLGAVHRLLAGGRRDDPACVWARAHGLDEPPPPRGGEVTLLDLADDLAAADDDGAEPVRADGHLRRAWAEDAWTADERGGDEPASSLARAATWAALALETRALQERALLRIADPRAAPTGTPLATLTAHAESLAALLAVELERVGLPLDRAAAESIVEASAGDRPADARAAEEMRAARDAEVLRHFPGSSADLRNPAAVRAMLAGAGVVVPDTRSWRLERHAAHPGVAALLAWRKAERIATTYGYAWLDRHVAPDGRLRGAWSASDGGAGRMTAQAGLHSLPAELRPAVRAEPGHTLVRADLGQVEPRVLAAVSGDPALLAATRADDLYSPIAAELRCERPVAKVAMLAAMYGQTSGAAGATLRRMDATYPRAMAYLRAAEERGRSRRDLRTYGGRLIPLSGASEDGDAARTAGRGRFARNAVIQGAAAELFKAWAATVRAGLREIGGEIALCLHDELLVHVPSERADDTAALLADALTATASWWAAGSGARFVVDVAAAERWSDAKG
jgi:DNA polymerase I